MGYYIEVPHHKDKATQLRQLHGAEVLTDVPRIADVPPDKVLICVAENPLFDAAGVAYDQAEADAFAEFDGRRKTWLLLDKAKALALQPRLKDEFEKV